MYAIAMAPEFGKFQIGSAKDDKDIELYEIKLYGDQVVTVERVNGCHVRSDSRGQTEHHQHNEVFSPYDGKPLPDIRYKTGMIPPSELACPNRDYA